MAFPGCAHSAAGGAGDATATRRRRGQGWIEDERCYESQVRRFYRSSSDRFGGADTLIVSPCPSRCHQRCSFTGDVRPPRRRRAPGDRVCPVLSAIASRRRERFDCGRRGRQFAGARDGQVVEASRQEVGSSRSRPLSPGRRWPTGLGSARAQRVSDTLVGPRGPARTVPGSCRTARSMSSLPAPLTR